MGLHFPTRTKRFWNDWLTVRDSWWTIAWVWKNSIEFWNSHKIVHKYEDSLNDFDQIVRLLGRVAGKVCGRNFKIPMRRIAKARRNFFNLSWKRRTANVVENWEFWNRWLVYWSESLSNTNPIPRRFEFDFMTSFKNWMLWAKWLGTLCRFLFKSVIASYFYITSKNIKHLVKYKYPIGVHYWSTMKQIKLKATKKKRKKMTEYFLEGLSSALKSLQGMNHHDNKIKMVKRKDRLSLHNKWQSLRKCWLTAWFS